MIKHAAAFLVLSATVFSAVAQLPAGTYLRVDPADLYVVGPPDPNVPVPDPCIENPTQDGCPCPIDPQIDPAPVYPNCPTDPPIPPDPCDNNPDLPECIEPECEDPIARRDDFYADWRGASVLTNDDLGGCPVQIDITRDPKFGEVEMHSDGTFDYEPDDPEYIGLDNFKYRITNPYGANDTRTAEFLLGTYVDPCDVDPDLPECQPPVDPCEEDPDLPECQQPDRPDVTYVPVLPPLGEYALENACLPIHDQSARTVTLGDNEPLMDALKRLQDIDQSGGVILVPWDVETLQCDTIKNTGGKAVDNLTLKGVLGPNGERPRFYCRAEKLDGTVTEGYGATFYVAGIGMNMVESLHVDGYGKWFQSNQEGHYRYRNNYAHHATNDGNGINGIDWGAPATNFADIQYCGNEFSHGGQGNTKHTFYIHRGTPESPIRVLLLQNTIHSTNWSSGYKSIANFNYIYMNKFYKTVPPTAADQPTDPANRLLTDPTYSQKYSQMMVDIVACSDSYVKDNYFYHWRPTPTGYAGGFMVALRNRKGIQGCDDPRGYIGDNKSAVPDYDSPFWKPEYWQSIEGTYPFTIEVSGNTFETRGPAGTLPKSNPIWTAGTYPNIASRQFGPACLLEAPNDWFERHKVYVHNNTYIQPNGTDLTKYQADYPGHSDGCDWPIPDSADKRTLDMFIIEEDGQ